MRTEPEERGTLTRTQILRARDVAALLHVPTSTVHEWARTGKLPSRKRGRHRLFILDEVEDWIHAEDESVRYGRISRVLGLAQGSSGAASRP